jgi:hypothetical protein
MRRWMVRCYNFFAFAFDGQSLYISTASYDRSLNKFGQARDIWAIPVVILAQIHLNPNSSPHTYLEPLDTHIRVPHERRLHPYGAIHLSRATLLLAPAGHPASAAVCAASPSTVPALPLKCARRWPGPDAATHQEKCLGPGGQE